MKKLSLVLAAAVLLAASLVIAETAPKVAKNYQVTGPVLELTDSMIVVQKDKDKWEIARNKDTKVTGELKVGEKVTIMYQMVAASIEIKAEKIKEHKEERKKK
jgi:hypothetical protein